MTIKENDETIYIYVLKNYKGSGNEIKNLKKFLTVINTKSNSYSLLRRLQQLIKHQLFTADVDIKSWLKVLNKPMFLSFYNDNLFCQMLRIQSHPI